MFQRVVSFPHLSDVITAAHFLRLDTDHHHRHQQTADRLLEALEHHREALNEVYPPAVLDTCRQQLAG